MPDKGWQRRFDDPIPLPKGRQLVTLKDAARYIQKLPKNSRSRSEGERTNEAKKAIVSSRKRQPGAE
jgi:hypothetical protein